LFEMLCATTRYLYRTYPRAWQRSRGRARQHYHFAGPVGVIPGPDRLGIL